MPRPLSARLQDELTQRLIEQWVEKGQIVPGYLGDGEWMGGESKVKGETVTTCIQYAIVSENRGHSAQKREKLSLHAYVTISRPLCVNFKVMTINTHEADKTCT